MTTLAAGAVTDYRTSLSDGATPARSGFRTISIVLVAAVFAVAIFSRLTYVAVPFDADGAMYSYMGKLVVDGGRFGEDLVDNKFPTVGLITSPFYRAFGAWWPGYVISQLVLAMAAVAMLASAAARAFGEHARWPTLLVAVTILNLNAAVMGGFQLETMLAFFACLSACAAMSVLKVKTPDPLIKGSGVFFSAFACGLAAGCAAMVKPTGGCVVVAFVVALAADFFNPRRRDRQFVLGLMCLLGVAIPALTSIAYLVATDTLTLIPAIASQIREYAASSSFSIEDLFRPGSVLALFAAAMLIRGWVYRRPAFRVVSDGPTSLWVFAIAWLTLEFIGVVSQRRMYAYHFLPLACPAALLFGALPRRATIGQLAGVLALPVILSVWGSFDTLERAKRENSAAPAVAAWLDEHCLPGERVWRDVTAAVLMRTDLRSASRMQLTFLFLNSDEAPPKFSSMLIDDLRNNRARYVVLPRDLHGYAKRYVSNVYELSRQPLRAVRFAAAWNDIQEFVASRYAHVATIGDEAIFELKELKN